ncbi:hypothetical protein RJ640_022761 [Escallonia rubra]|uniref:Integrase zinc-binding domain-containing protein n=1 Tax=Escallonia rubra TaxID=112253 RepID=A0AA88R608_9ASTE|nr:hypothetical protein RJ640_022761 [Escallonia rubra]
MPPERPFIGFHESYEKVQACNCSSTKYDSDGQEPPSSPQQGLSAPSRPGPIPSMLRPREFSWILSRKMAINCLNVPSSMGRGRQDMQGHSGMNNSKALISDLLRVCQNDGTWSRKRTYKDLELYTDNFSKENYIEDFQFGKIYHGKVLQGKCAEPQLVTVKIREVSELYKQYPGDNELRMLDELVLLRHEKLTRHPVMVRLFGYCYEDEHFGVVYDFKSLNTVYNLVPKGYTSSMPNCKFLFKTNTPKLFGVGAIMLYHHIISIGYKELRNKPSGTKDSRERLKSNVVKKEHVPGIFSSRVLSTYSETSFMLLSGMRLVQEVEGEEAKKSEGTYLASLKVEDNITSSTEQPPKGMVGVLKGKEVALPCDQPWEMVGVFKGKKDAMPRGQPSREVKDVLKGKTDVVPCEFEKRQPPRRKVDREGKLERGTKPQNVAPCGMVPPKVEKLSTTSKAKGEIIKLIKEGLQRDPLAKELLQLVKSGKTQRYRVKGGQLYTKYGRVYVPKWKDLRRMVIRESHDTQSTVHPGHRRTYALVTMAYFWPQMKEVQMCVKTCHVCQKFKGKSQADEAKLLDATQVLHVLRRREAEYVLGDKLERGRGREAAWRLMEEITTTGSDIEEKS